MSIKNLGENVLQQKELDNERRHEKQDFYGEIGCCLTCDETLKENIRGVQRDVWFQGKHYDCLCLEGKCKKCSWYYNGECQRTEVII